MFVAKQKIISKIFDCVVKTAEIRFKLMALIDVANFVMPKIQCGLKHQPGSPSHLLSICPCTMGVNWTPLEH